MRKWLLRNFLIFCTLSGLALAAGALPACNSAGPVSNTDVISQALAQPGVLILDVRSPGEYASGHVEGAVLLPVAQVGDRIELIAPNKEAQIIVYCASGGRAGKAAEVMASKGYTKVLNAKTPEALAKAVGKPLVK